VTLFLEALQRYLGSTADGTIKLLEKTEESIYWIMQIGEMGGYTFESHKYRGRILSYREESQFSDEASEEDGKEWSMARLQKMANDYKKKDAVQRMLWTTPLVEEKSDTDHATETSEQRCYWRLDPILPRAISSSKIRTFAIGTGIAIGTTIAMPFA